MLARGDRIFDVAYWFGVAEEEIQRVSEGNIPVELELRFSVTLPPPGPYPPIRAVRSAIAVIERAVEDLNFARAAIGLPPYDFVLPMLTDARPIQRVEISEQKKDRLGIETRELKKPSTELMDSKPTNPKYQPPAQKSSEIKIAPKPERAEPERDRAAPIQVRLMMERGGFCRLTLLPRRTPEMPVEIEVFAGKEKLVLAQLQEEWFEDVEVADLGSVLREGAAWTAALPENQTLRLVLSGREIYVLGHHSHLSGFVSTAKALLGETHAVLCTTTVLDEVTSVIAESGSPTPTTLGTDSGIPAGWVGLLGVKPSMPIASTVEADILNVLRPNADVRIAFEGGIRIARSSWLLGHPPRIHIQGQLASDDTALLDGKSVQLDSMGCLAPKGTDQLGQHSVSYGNMSRTYNVVEGLQHWEPWDAYCWSQGDVGERDGRPHATICGPLVRAPGDGSQVLLLPSSSAIILGAVPGEIARSEPGAVTAASQVIALPNFESIWATPANILHSDKRVAKVLFVGDRRLVQTLHPPDRLIALSDANPATRRKHIQQVKAWCTTILDAGRKGLKTDPPEDEIAALWVTYKQRARSIWRRLR